MDSSSLTSAATTAIVATTVPLVLGWLMRQRSGRARPAAGGGGVMSYSRAFKGFMILGAVLFTGFAVLVGLGREQIVAPGSVKIAFGLFVLFDVACLWGVAEVFGVAHRIGETGIERVTPFSRRLFLPWSEVRALTYSQGNRWFVLESRHGEKVRVSEYLSGMGDLAGLILRHVPGEVVYAQPGAAERLKQALD